MNETPNLAAVLLRIAEDTHMIGGALTADIVTLLVPHPETGPLFAELVEAVLAADLFDTNGQDAVYPLHDGDRLLIVDADQFRDEDGVDHDAWATALAEEWRLRARRISQKLASLVANDEPGLHVNIWIPDGAPVNEVAAFETAVGDLVMGYGPRAGWDPHMMSTEIAGG